MPPRKSLKPTKPTKPTSGLGPSDDGGGPSDGRKELTDDESTDYERTNHDSWVYRLPLFGRMLNDDEVDLIFFAYHRYLHEGRPLMQEEICGIIWIWLGKQTSPYDMQTIFKTFDDPENPATK